MEKREIINKYKKFIKLLNSDSLNPTSPTNTGTKTCENPNVKTKTYLNKGRIVFSDSDGSVVRKAI